MVSFLIKFAIGTTIALFLFWVLITFTGDGAYKRAVTLSGVYTILRPDGFDVVCFADSDGKDGGLFCIPCESASCPVVDK
jgi:hypothetical protein